jgi:hypothetical protein
MERRGQMGKGQAADRNLQPPGSVASVVELKLDIAGIPSGPGQALNAAGKTHLEREAGWHPDQRPND